MSTTASIVPASARLCLTLYSALYGLSLPLLLPLLAWHPRLRGGLAQRLGSTGRIPGTSPGPVWLHGASAGDIVALTPLVRRLQSSGVPAVVSAWTRSGAEMATLGLDGIGRVIRAPLDLAGPVRATLDRLAPRALVLECLEMWPRLVCACHRRGIPVVVVNGRLSPRSLSLYRRARWLFEPCFRGLSRVVASSEEHARRFVLAGAPAERVTIATSTKYCDLQIRDLHRRAPRRRIVLGSLHDGEEQRLLPRIPPLLQQEPAAEVVVVPRYPHRAAATRRRLARLGIRAGSATEADPAAGDIGRVLVVDGMGQLARLYHNARAAFIGGSLVPHGGHNPVEAAACGCPVLIGPSTYNCSQEVKLLLDCGGGIEVSDGDAWLHQTLQLLRDPTRFAECSAGGLTAARTLVEASRRALEGIQAHLSAAGAGAGAGAGVG
jgi:3-deoxy-D-manno-octulosonic-acid transferase